MKKKSILTVLAILISTLTAFSQHYETIQIEGIATNVNNVYFCTDDADLLGVIIYGETDCPNQTWEWYYNFPMYETIHKDSIVILNNHEEQDFMYVYYGCNITKDFTLHYVHALQDVPTVDSSIIWKKTQGGIALCTPWGGNWQNILLWSTGETQNCIYVIDPKTYSVTLQHPCEPVTHNFEVRDNVELYRATVDLRTNKNKVTWLATPEQAEYITDVKIYRDGTLVGTAPYTSGYFLDAIGSDAAARTYQIVGVSKEGDDCPIPSYQKGTIHTTYYQDVNNDLNMTWNIPYVEEGAQGQLTGFEIYKYSPATEELTLIDAVNASITDYTCNANAFIGGQATIAAVFSSKDMESRSFSNLNTVLAVDENEGNNFKIYPNPAIGRITVEGTGSLSITNIVGQTILTKEIDGQATIELPRGMYFVQMNDVTRKIVVE